MFGRIVNSEEFEGDNWQNQLTLWLPARPTYFTVIACANTRKVSDQIQIQINQTSMIGTSMVQNQTDAMGIYSI